MKESLQFQRTTRDIIKATWKLLEEENFNKITVKQLMDEAMISRSTFYQHFSDKYAIVEQIEDEYLDEFKCVITKNSIWGGQHRSYKEINRSLKKFFVGYNKQLKILDNIDDTNLNFVFRLKNVMIDFITERATFLGDLEVRILAAQVTEYFVYYIDHPDKVENMANNVFRGQLDLILSTFGIQNSEENRKQLKDTLISMMGL